MTSPKVESKVEVDPELVIKEYNKKTIPKALREQVWIEIKEYNKKTIPKALREQVLFSKK